MTYAAIQTLTTNLVRAPVNKITPEQLSEALSLAVLRYGEDKPRAVPEDVFATGGLDLPLPLGWIEGESALLGVEYPPGQFPPAYLPSNEFGLVPTPDGEVIRLADSLNAGETVRVHFGLPHLLDATHCTIPARHREAFCSWAAAILCDQIAGTFANNSAPTIQADSADTSNPAREWRTRANGFRSRYAALLGVQGVTGGSSDKPVAKPAGAVVEFDLQDSRNRGWLGKFR